MFKASVILSLGLLAGSAFAECRLAGGAVDPSNKTQTGEYTDPKTAIQQGLCDPQGEGSWTFSYQTSMVDVPAIGTTGFPGAASADGWMIFDESCHLRGAYTKDSCGIPASIDENFLPYVLELNQVDEDTGAPSFLFNYANGQYKTGTNQCGCSHYFESGGLQPVQSCKCAFPIHGEPAHHKRAIAFEA